MTDDPRVAKLTAFWGYAPDNTSAAENAIALMENAGLTVIEPDDDMADLADVWDQGYQAGWDRALDPDLMVIPLATNPYRPEPQ